MNTIMAHIQQVTTRSQAKNKEWTEQDDIRKAAQASVEKENAEGNKKQMKREVYFSALQQPERVKKTAMANDNKNDDGDNKREDLWRGSLSFLSRVK